MSKNKLTGIFAFLVGVAVVGILVFMASKDGGEILRGIDSGNLNYYNTATSTSAVCSGATSTLITAASTQLDTRSAFEITVASSTNITLCKAGSGCGIGNGLTIKGGGGSYEQTDVYSGAYSCIGNGASSTIGVFVRQR